MPSDIGYAKGDPRARRQRGFTAAAEARKKKKKGPNKFTDALKGYGGKSKA